MRKTELLDPFIDRCRADQERLLAELRSYRPIGVLWRGRSVESLREITDERIGAIERELAGIEATIELATTIAKVL